MKRLSLAILTVLLTGCGTSATAPIAGSVTSSSQKSVANEARPAAVSQAAARLSIEPFEGIQDHIARSRGKVVVMDAWSTSCPPCMKEFHHLVDLHKKYGSEKLACISLSFDYEGLGKPEEQQDRVLAFLRQQGAEFDNLMSSEESDVLYRKFKLAAVPAVFVYDRAGVLRKRFDNEKATSKAEAFTYEQIGALVAELLSENPPQQESEERTK